MMRRLTAMSDCFIGFSAAQIDVMRRETAFDKKNDPEVENRIILEWIEQHAADFRNKWDKRHRQ